jgi:uncharacterized protein
MPPSGLADKFRSLVHQIEFPCVGAKSALAKGTLYILVARDMTSNWDDRRIYEGITRVVEAYRHVRCFKVLPLSSRVL